MIKHGTSKPSIKEFRTNKQPLELVKQYIHDNLFNNISLTFLASLSGLSSYYLVRQFQKIYGLPPHAYQIQARLHKSKGLLKKGISVSHVAVELGFHDQSHFHRHFVKANGISPGNYANHVYPSHLKMQLQS
jgi:AraC-like DNA-binding protein